MKKGLSVLLIAAALFGFYGGAVNLNDVLACKDYWEEEGKKSTADMNKLEDGLNQLKDNEQAYLDGLDKVAEGEDALAQGEADYAEGQATLAKGEADYAAAPGKLADARKQIAKGESDLAAGEDALAAGYAERNKGQKTLEAAIANKAMLLSTKNKIDQVEPAYNPWLQKFGKLRTSIVDNPEKPTKGVLFDAGAVAVGLVGNEDNDGLLQAFGSLKNMADQAAGGAAQYKDGMDQVIAGVKAALEAQGMTGVTDEVALEQLNTNPAFADTKKKYDGLKEKYTEYATLAKTLEAVYNHLDSTYKGELVRIATSINGKINNIKGATYQATELRNTDFSKDMADTKSLLNNLSNDPVLKQAAAQKPELAQKLSQGIGQVMNLVTASESSKKTYDTNYDELKPNASLGQKIGSKVASAATAILSTPDIAGSLSAAQREALKPYTSASSITGLPNIELLYGTMTLGKDMKDDGQNSLLDSLNAIKAGAAGGIKQYTDGINDGQAKLDDADDKLAAGEKELAAGRAKLAAGKKQYAQGLADYKAAPAKLAAGRAALAEGLQKLMDGRKELAAGKDKLAEYEDGEQQVRDGLATLMGTEPNGGLESILDRRSGDDDFDNGDKHLDLDEGLDAVDVGRGYQADSGELITKEITNRAIGTAAGFGAGALAVLAAILSFLKKNKGAGVLALLSAAAGGAGIAAGTSAGTEFSSIAGSAVGATPWIAFGILAAVAAVHAIAHFASKEA